MRILKIIKYLFIAIITIMVILTVAFVYYSRKLDYEIPKFINVKVYDREGNEFFSLNNNSKQNYVRLNQIDEDIINAFISIEDKKFFTHQGIDIKRIGGALLADISSKEITQGASPLLNNMLAIFILVMLKTFVEKLKK